MINRKFPTVTSRYFGSAIRSMASSRWEVTARDCLPDSNATIESIVADIDASKDHVHLTFYIWLPDNTDSKSSRRSTGR